MNKRIQITVDPQLDLILSSIAQDLCMTKSELCSFIIFDQVNKFLFLESELIPKIELDN